MALRRGALRVRAAAPAVLASLIVVAGCSSDAEPSPMPTPSSSPSPSETSGPTPPAMPAEAEGRSPAAAKAFVRHYFDQINYAALTGDTAMLRALSTDDCESCDAIASNVERIYGDGGRIRSDGWRLTLVRLVHSSDGPVTLSLGVHMTRERVVDSSGVIDVNRAAKQPMTIRLANRNSGFLVKRMDLVT